MLGPAWRFVIEQDAAAGEQAERLAKIDRLQMSEHLRAGVRAAGMKGGQFVVRRVPGRAEHLAGRGLVEPELTAEPVAMPTHRFEQPDRPDAVGQRKLDRIVERRGHLA